MPPHSTISFDTREIAAVSVYGVPCSDRTSSMVYCASASVTTRASASVNWIFMLVTAPDEVIHFHRALVVALYDYGMRAVPLRRVTLVQFLHKISRELVILEITEPARGATREQFKGHKYLTLGKKCRWQSRHRWWNQYEKQKTRRKYIARMNKTTVAPFHMPTANPTSGFCLALIVRGLKSCGIMLRLPLVRSGC
jgi:hypothetical protein